MKFSGKVANLSLNKRLNLGGDPGHGLDTGLFSGFVTIGRDTESGINRLRCATLLCRHALAGIAIATMASLRHRPTTDSGTDIATLVRHALAEVCTVPMLLVIIIFLFFVTD